MVRAMGDTGCVDDAPVVPDAFRGAMVLSRLLENMGYVGMEEAIRADESSVWLDSLRRHYPNQVHRVSVRYKLIIASYLSLWPANGHQHPVKCLNPNTNGVGLTQR